MNRSKRAYTLIELLIVMAMIVIIASGLIATLIGPLREQVTADGERAAESGLATALAHIVSEAHSSSHTTFAGAERRLSFEIAGKTISYDMSPTGDLRRDTGNEKMGSLLLQNVKQFDVNPADDGRAIQVVLVVQQSRLGSPIPLKRSVELTLAGTPLEVRP